VYERDANTQRHTNDTAGLCAICRDPSRDSSIIAVVEKETDLVTIEKTKKYHGLYHVLGGTLSPLDDAENREKIEKLISRIKKSALPVKEVILALGLTAEGDFTAMELEKALRDLDVKISRLGRGLPRGAEVEFADEETIASALEGRK